MGFKDLAEVIDVREPKVLPIMGRAVVFPDVVSAATGATLLAMVSAGRLLSTGDSLDDAAAAIVAVTDLDAGRWLEMTDEVLGAGAAELTELGVMGRARMHVISTLAVWHIMGGEAAEHYWDSAGKATAPKTAPRKAPSDRATSAKTGGQSSKAGGSARTRSTVRPSTARRAGG